MKKIYFAGRLSPNPDKEDVLEISKDMTFDDVYAIYTSKTIKRADHIKNGHWILRPPNSQENNLPKNLPPYLIWQMVKKKIEGSDIFAGVINLKSFGTILEAGYACSLNKMPVYLFFDKDLSIEEQKDLWFVIQSAKNTQGFWSEEDMALIEYFKERNIASKKDYQEYLDAIIPKFLQN